MAKINNQFIIVGIGEILWDIFPEGKKLGGAPANFAYHAQELGARSFVVSAVGDDELGKELFEQLEYIGLSKKYIAVLKQHPTGTVTVKLDFHGNPEFTIHENVAWDYIPYSSKLEKLAKTADAVCFGTLAQRSEVSRQTLRSFLKSTTRNCLRIYDINIRQNFYSVDIIRESLLLSHCLKLNEKELPIVAEMFSLRGSEDEILKTLIREFNLKIVTLTKGEKGSKLVTADEYSILESSQVNVEDTVGAGDSFTAALAVGLLKNLPLKIIHRNANILASYVCSQKGATPFIPEELKSEILSAH